jgi:N4-(beta-N-acetylglucosaminyl)-L-asparaginase
MSDTAEPKLLLTWSFGRVGAEAAWPALSRGEPALDCAILAADAIETDPSIDSVGIGGLPDLEGLVSLDGCVMTDPNRAGAVAFVRHYPHVCRLARAVMEKTIHITLAGDGAEAFAQREGFEPANLLTTQAHNVWEQWRKDPSNIDIDKYRGWIPPANIEELRGLGSGVASAGGGPGLTPGLSDTGDVPEPHHDTVGIIARDKEGKLAGACSTSGMAFKVPGRVGDSPIIGQGLYVDQEAGAASATGTGELITGVCATFLVVEEMRRGAEPEAAIAEALTRITKRFTLRDEHQVAITAMRPDGKWATGAIRKGFKHTIMDESGMRVEEPTFTLME